MSARKRLTLEERLWRKVQKGGPDECWLWTGGHVRGYGHLMLDNAPTPTGKTTIKVHRLSYELAVGPIPSGMQVDHICFNRSCVNPAHLRIVTNKQNNEHAKGPRSHNTSGYRGVSRDRTGSWRAHVTHHGKTRSKSFATIEEATAAAAAMRAELFTHDDANHASRLVSCPSCDGTGKVPAAWDAPEGDDCPDCEASGLVTRSERDQLAATADTWQHRGRP